MVRTHSANGLEPVRFYQPWAAGVGEPEDAAQPAEPV
jgi:hypothetical protein